MRFQVGFTLLGLLVGVTVLAILLAFATPTFENIMLDGERAARVNRFLHGMHVASQEAEKRGMEVVMCRSSTGRRCAHSLEWTAGFLVFANRDRDQPPQVDAGEPVLQVGPLSRGGSIVANRQSFIWRPYGRRSVNGTLTFCDRRGTAHARSIIVSPTGRPRPSAVSPDNGPLSCGA